MKKTMKQDTKKLPTANREYKSTMFCMLFQDKKQLLELYNAVNHSHYEDAEALEIVTLENAIYMNMKNDLAFLIDMHLNLYEHQSTFNPNMPLRDLFYVAKEYQRLVENDSLYASSLVRIPAPRFVVFYNGREKRPEEEMFCLSDAYYTRESAPELELKVRALNLNAGNNRELLESCRTLKEYMLYVDWVRTYAEEPGMSLEEAVDKAVRECIDKGILAEFLRRNRAEAISVSIFEYNEAVEKEKLRKAEFQGGYDVGYDAGVTDGISQGIEQGIERGICALILDNIEEGHDKEEIVAKLIKLFGISIEQAESYFDRFANRFGG